MVYLGIPFKIHFDPVFAFYLRSIAKIASETSEEQLESPELLEPSKLFLGVLQPAEPKFGVVQLFFEYFLKK